MMSLMEQESFAEREAEGEAEGEVTTMGQAEMAGPETEGEEMDDSVSQMTGCDSCTKTANYRNSFYPQYVNMKPDAYLARYSGGNVSGYDQDAYYSSM